MEFDLNVEAGLDTFEDNLYEKESSTSYHDSSEEEFHVFRHSPIMVDEISPSTNDAEGKAGTGEGQDDDVADLDSNALIIADIEKKLGAGITFGSLEEARLLYFEYGRLKGFSVRLGNQRYKGSTRELRWKDYECQCGGRPVETNSDSRGTRSVKRTGCLAKMRVRPSSDRAGKWINTLFLKDHNHPLLAPDQSYLSRSSRIVSQSRLGVIQAMSSAGIRVCKGLGFIELESGGAQNVGYTRKDVYNKLRRLKKDGGAGDGDARALMDYFKTRSISEPFFFWRAAYDEDHCIKHLFFRDSVCLSDYECFGDVLSIDTTYKTNKYNLSCAPFVGVNHHNSTISFGVGFLSEENTETFEWLLGVFLESVNGKMPKVVLSDQCRALMNAIDSTFPGATHRLCQWHVNNNAIKHFGSLNGNAEFKRLWHRCMRHVETEEEFDDVWAEMMANHVDDEHTWLHEMYNLRRRWASVFSQDTFSAGMVATSRSEGTNKVLKDMIRSSSTLYAFVLSFEKVQTRWREVERAQDAESLWPPAQFAKKNQLLTQAGHLYTRKIYKKIEVQCAEAYNCRCEWRHAVCVFNGDVEFKVGRHQYPGSRPRTVVFNMDSKIARCSCRMWEGHGILCRHIMKVYLQMDVTLIPEELIHKRWTKKAKDIILSDRGARVIPDANDITRFLDFSNFMHRSLSEMIASSKGNVIAQQYLIDLIRNGKACFPPTVMGPPIPDERDCTAKGPHQPKREDRSCTGKCHVSQVKNPKKVKCKGPVKNEPKKKRIVSKTRGGLSKCPGISRTSRKCRTYNDGRSLSDSLDLNISLTQPGQKSTLDFFGLEENNSMHGQLGFFATQ